MTGTYYVLIDDKKKVAGAKTFTKKDPVVFKEWNEKGWGVYFSANEFSTARQNDLCTKLRYVYADLDLAKAGDGVSREEKQRRKQILLKALLDYCEPTLIIDTSNGLQPLWQITDNDPTAENKALYVKVIKGIVEWSKQFGGKADNVHDLARILRLVGYYHQKEEPYLCDFIHKSKKKYSLFELELLFPYEEKIVEPRTYETTDNSNPVFQEIEKIDFKELIIKAFASVGRPVTFDKSGRLIDPIGGTTGTFIGRKGNRDYLCSSSHEPFKGNRITAVADILKIDYSDAYKWIVKEYSLDFKKLIQKEKVLEQMKEVEKPKRVKKDKRYSWGTDYLNHHFAIIKPTNFIVIAAKRNSGKTTFTFDMAIKNAEMGNKVLYLSLEMETDDITDDFGRKYSGITVAEEFDKTIPEYKKIAYDKKRNEINTTPNLFVEGIRRNGDIVWETIVEIIKKYEGIDMIFIDNLDLIAGREGESENQRQKRLVTQMMSYSSENQTPIILVHHYRKSTGGKDHGMDELGGSGKISDGADRVVKVVKNPDPLALYPDKYRTTIYLQKGRGYPEHNAEIYFIRGRFQDLPPSQEQYENKELQDVAESFGGNLEIPL